MINRVTLIGRLGKDPEIHHFEGGSTVARFTLATSESFKDKNGEWKEQTEWHNIVVWRELAQRAEKYLKKGMLVFVEGKLTYRQWEDKNNNNTTRYITEIQAFTIRTLEKRDNAPMSEQGQSSNESPIAESAPIQADTDDGLPF